MEPSQRHRPQGLHDLPGSNSEWSVVSCHGSVGGRNHTADKRTRQRDDLLVHRRITRLLGNEKRQGTSSRSHSTARCICPVRADRAAGRVGQHLDLIVFGTPTDDGGMPITNYQYSLDDGATWRTWSPTVTKSPATISGLQNGKTYKLKIRAVNQVGPGAASNAWPVTPSAPPKLPAGAIDTTDRNAVINAYSTRLSRASTSHPQGPLERFARDLRPRHDRRRLRCRHTAGGQLLPRHVGTRSSCERSRMVRKSNPSGPGHERQPATQPRTPVRLEVLVRRGTRSGWSL